MRSSQRVLEAKVNEAFSHDAERTRLSIFYQLALLLVAFLVVLLPVIYIGMIVAVGYGVYWHTINDVHWMGDGAREMGTRAGGKLVLLQVLAYCGVIVAGVLLVGFMLKPFIAPRVEREVGPTLLRQDQPLLFGFVDGLCDQLGAPIPKRIEVICDVNASASFRRGWLSLFSNDLVLTIGLPLAAGMTVQQLGGVIAHEFGHFRQGLAMRLDFLISSVNRWFARVVYERDGWDESVQGGMQSESLYIIVFCLFMAFLIFMVRRVLWVLMMVAHVLSMALSRQMEYDADRAAASIIGSKAIGPMLLQLHVLAEAFGESHHRMQEELADKRLYDNLPEYTAVNAKNMQRNQRTALEERLLLEKTALFDTHPSLASRVRRANRADLEGILTISSPASKLFQDFRKLSKNVTYAYYRLHLGDDLQLLELKPTDKQIETMAERSDHAEALDGYLLGASDPARLPKVAIKMPGPPRDPAAVAAELNKTRQRFADKAEGYAAILRQWNDARHETLRFSVALQLLRCRVPKAMSGLPEELQDAEAVTQRLEACKERLRVLNETLREYDAVIQKRVSLALSMLMLPGAAKRLDEATKMREEAGRCLQVLEPIAIEADMLAAIEQRRDMVGVWARAQATFRNFDAVGKIGEKLIAMAEHDIKHLAAISKNDASMPADQLEPIDDDDVYGLTEDTAARLDDPANPRLDYGDLNKLKETYLDALSRLFVIAQRIEKLVQRPAAPESQRGMVVERP